MMKLEIPDGYFSDEERINTPKRWKRFWKEFEGTDDFKFTTFPNSENVGDMVVVKDIPLYSLCSHHLLPFFGKAHIAYIPHEKICGLSKIPRLLRYYASRPQIQERLTKQVADSLEKELMPKGTMVVIEARHLCMEMRGIRATGASTTTSAMRGAFIHDDVRSEFMRLIR